MKRSIAMLAALALLLGFGLPAPPAQADYNVTLLEQNGNVVATGSGTIDLTDLTLFSSGVLGNKAGVYPILGIVAIGPSSATGADEYQGFTGPSSLGGGGQTFASSGSGDFIDIGAGFLDVPVGYVSGHSLSDTSTYDNKTFAKLGVTPGTYVWTWGTGTHADSFTLQVGPATATPEPASLTLLGIGAVGLLGYGWRRRRRAAI
jgi:hypothetical protein